MITGPEDFKTFGKTVIGIANRKIKSKFCPDSYIPLVYIDDVINITIKALDMPIGNKYVVVGENVKISDVFDIVCSIKNSINYEYKFRVYEALLMSLVSWTL